MSIPGSASPLFLTSAAAEVADYQIDRSLRFDSDSSSYFSRTPSSAGNRKTWTWSGWVKRSKSAAQYFFAAVPNASAFCQFLFNSDDTISLQFRDSSANAISTTDAVFRDFSAWYHIVFHLDTTQSTASDRMKLWVNGVEQTFSTDARSSITQNGDYEVNNTSQHAISSQQPYASSGYVDGYLAEIHFVDGQALAATDFGEYDDNNLWQPKDCKDDLTYGTNGFYLPFSDATSTTTISEDDSGNNNDWTANNISVTAGAGNDSLIDTPTNYEAGSGNNGGNYCTLNSLETGDYSALSNGNLDQTGGATDYSGKRGTFSMTTGKWYWEVTINATSGFAPGPGIQATDVPNYESPVSTRRTYYNSGQKFDGSLSSYGSSFTTGDIIGVAFDADAGSLTFYKNGTTQGVAFSSLSDGPYSPLTADFNGSSTSHNFGQRPFAYTPPTGFLSLCTTNLPDPTIADGSTAMDVVTYSGDGTNGRDITVNHSTDFVWIKTRNINDNNILADSVRGTNKILYSNLTLAERTESNSVTGFNANGFTVASNAGAAAVNYSTYSYVAWSWDGGSSTVSNTDGSITSNVRASASNGFSIISYTGNGTAGATIGHGLNAAPAFVIQKNRDASNNWQIFHVGAQTSGAKQLKFTSSAAATNTTVWNDTAPSSSVITLGYGGTNSSGNNHIIYCWAPVEGYSSFGKYEGNGLSDGPFVFTGFRVRWLLLKSTAASYGIIYDTSRSTYNATETALYPGLSNGDTSEPNNKIDILSNGFKLRAAGGSNPNINPSGTTVVYAAFAEHPFASNARAR